MNSELFYNSFALFVTLILFAGIFILAKKGLGFATLTLIALVAGTGLGLTFTDNLKFVNPIGDIYVQVITALVAPLIFVSIISSVTSLGNLIKLRTIGASSVFWLLLTNVIAIALTLLVSLAIGLGKGVELDWEGQNPELLTNLLVPLDEVIVGLFPSNLVTDFQRNNIIPIIIYALMLAIAYILAAAKNEKKVLPFKNFIDAFKEVLFKAVGFIVYVTPYAVLALVAYTVATAAGRLQNVLSLVGVLIVTVVIAFVSAYLVNGILLKVFAKVNPIQFFRKLTPAQYTAFTTQSSVGTLPLTIGALTKKVGVSQEVANFTAPIGTTIGMPGCAGIWPIVVAVFSVNALGIDYSVTDYLLLSLVCLLVSVGTAGVPGTAIITATAVLTAVGLPVEILVLLIPISAVAGTASTMANVSAAATAAAIVARRNNQLNDEVFATEIEPNSDGGDADASAGNPDTTVALQAAGLGSKSRLNLAQLEKELTEVELEIPVGQCEVK